MKKVLIFFVLLIVVLFVYSVFVQVDNKPVTMSLTEKVAKIAEMNTLRYDYEVSKSYTSDSATWFKIFTIKGLVDVAVVTFPGTIKFGFDFKDVEIIEPQNKKMEQNFIDKIPYLNQNDDSIETKPEKIVVKIPHTSILSHEIHWEKMDKPITLKNTPFSSFNYNDFVSNTTELKKEFENRAKEKGLFEEADNSAIEQVTRLFQPFLQEGQILEVIFKD